MEADPVEVDTNLKQDKFLCTIQLDEGADFCNWKIPDESTWGDFFTCFAYQHEIGGGKSHEDSPLMN